MVSIKIDNVTVNHEMPVEFILDGTEEFNLGSLKIVNVSTRTPYPDWADVVVTINSVDYEAIVQKDLVTRTAPNLYQHEIILAEPVIKLSQYIMADRYYTTIDGSVITYEDQIDNILETHDFGKTSPLTVATATRTLLDTDATEKEYSGGDLLTTLTDMFRSVNAVPTLSLDNEIGHELFGEMRSLITIGDLIGETIISDISDYGMAVHSKVKNATYEGDAITGGTYFPSKSFGITPRNVNPKYDDDDAEYFLDSGIRRIIDARILNVEVPLTGGTFIEAQIADWIVSKEEWDNLEIERDVATLHAGFYKNNTFYFVEGDSVIKNVGTKYLNSTALVTGDDVMEQLIKSWFVQDGGGYVLADYHAQNIRDMEIRFYYQAVRDMDVRTERHDISRVDKRATLINNQKDSKLELQRYGKALKSQINRVGNDKYEITMRYNNHATFYLYSLNDYTSDGYKIVKMQFLARHGSLDVMYQLVKNASILNPFTSINRSVSPFTVTKRNVLSCFVYNEYFEISTVNRTDTGLLTLLGRKALLNGLSWNTTYNTPIYNAQFMSTNSGGLYIGLTATGIPLGNSLIFNAEFQEPKVAGYQLVADDGGVTGDRMKPISYTDLYGQVDTANIGWYNTLAGVADTHPITTVGSNPLMSIKNYTVGLNPNETFGITICEHIISNLPNIIIGDCFVEENSLIKEIGVPSLTLSYWAGTVKYNIYDKYKKSSAEGTGSYIVETTAYNQISISSVPTGKTWAIHETTSPYRLYLACNYEDTDYSVLYFNNLTDRPNTETL